MENLEQSFDIIVIGGGIVGCATAYKIQQKFPTMRIAILEKEASLAYHQTSRNSGVIHSGIYYKPGSSKAKNCVDGRRELVQFARENGIKHDICGKLIVATEPWELPILNQIYARGEENHIEEMEWLDATQIKLYEPHCDGIKAIRVGCTGIIDFKQATEKMAELMQAIQPESKIFLNTRVKQTYRNGPVSVVDTPKGIFTARYLIFCSGLQSDQMALRDGVKPYMKIVGFRGDYYELTDAGKHKVKNLIYPVPNPAFPFLGVHFTRMTDGSIECGPNAVFTFKREGYNKTSFSFADTWDSLGYAGTWKLFKKNWKFGMNEYKRAFSKALFLQTLQRLVPDLTMDDIEPGRSGVRAMALDTNGEIIDDFKIAYTPHSIHVLNAPSPAATASLAIGNEICQMAEKQFLLHEIHKP